MARQRKQKMLEGERYNYGNPYKGTHGFYRVRVWDRGTGALVATKSTRETSYSKAEYKRFAIRREMERPPDADVILETAAREWLDSPSLNAKARPVTKDEYERILNRDILPQLGKMRVMDLRLLDCEKVVFADDAKFHSIRMRRMVLYLVLKFAKKNHRLDNNPAADIELPRREKKDRLALSVEEARRLVLIAQAGTIARECSGKRQGGVKAAWVQPVKLPRTLPLALLLGLRQGLRVKNILGATWANVKFKDDQPDHLEFQAAEMKSGRRFLSALHADTKALIMRELHTQGRVRPDERLCLDCPSDAANFFHMVRRLGNDLARPIKETDPARAEQLCGLGPHALRRTFATQLSAPLAVIACLLDHSPSSTMGTSGLYVCVKPLDPSVLHCLAALPSLLPAAQEKPEKCLA